MDSSKERIGLSNMNGDQEQSMKLEDLQANAAVRGILSDGLVTVVSVQLVRLRSARADVQNTDGEGRQ